MPKYLFPAIVRVMAGLVAIGMVVMIVTGADKFMVAMRTIMEPPSRPVMVVTDPSFLRARPEQPKPDQPAAEPAPGADAAPAVDPVAAPAPVEPPPRAATPAPQATSPAPEAAPQPSGRS